MIQKFKDAYSVRFKRLVRRFNCDKCEDCGWVCENHNDKPWEGHCESDDYCKCGGAGMPCECNPLSKTNA